MPGSDVSFIFLSNEEHCYADTGPKHCVHFGAPQHEKNKQQMTNKIPDGTGA